MKILPSNLGEINQLYFSIIFKRVLQHIGQYNLRYYSFIVHFEPRIGFQTQ